MALPKPNEFQEYELSPEEEFAGRSLNGFQVCALQNRMAQIAIQKLNAKCTPDNFQEYMQEDAYLQGQLDILRLLIDDSIAAAEEVKFHLASQLNPEGE